MDERERDIELDRRGGLKSLGVHMARLTAPLARKRGTATARLSLEWPRIVGSEIARYSQPERLVGGAGGAKPAGAKADPTSGGKAATPAGRTSRPGGTLRLRVDGPLALELQHLEPQLIERINGYFGYAAVARVQIIQGPLPHRPTITPPRPAPLDADRARILSERVAAVGDARLRAALERLGRSVLTRR